MVQFPKHIEIELPRLTDPEIDSIVRAVFRHIDNVPDSLPTLIRTRAEGNPLFVEEFIYMLFDNGIIETGADGKWRVNLLQYSTRSSKMPGGLVAILQARLDELSTSARCCNGIIIGVKFGPAMVPLIGLKMWKSR
jgi:predicted ATPase